MDDEKKLTIRQALFIIEYPIDCDATNAAIRAGYSKKSAKNIGHELKNKPHIKKRIDKVLMRRVKKTQVNAEWVLKELEQMAFSDIADAYDENGKLKSIHDIPKPLRKMISSIDVFDEYELSNGNRKKVGETKKVKFIDRLKLIGQLGKHTNVQAWLEKHEHSGKVTLEDIVSGEK